MLKPSAVRKYLERHRVDEGLLPDTDVKPDMIVVIPCYDESFIFTTLGSLKNNDFDGFAVEVIVVVNSGENAPQSVIEQNRSTYRALKKEADFWTENIILSPVIVENVRRKHAGVGYARQLGMDMAVLRFEKTNNEDGFIISLDADTKVAKNYFKEIYQSFKENPRRYGVILKFEHALHGDDFSNDVYEGIALYELHLRYVNEALRYSGFPYVHHTVGSAFAVRASAYVAHGGMNRRQGGEDFYFLHKLFPHGEFKELNTTTVYPSARPSHRVPFGTGPQIRDYLCSKQLLTYNIEAFKALKAFIENVPRLYTLYVEFSPCVEAYLKSVDFEEHLEEIRRNSGSPAAFVKRFFVFFDAFKVIKFLNFSHGQFFQKRNVTIEALLLLQLIGVEGGLKAETEILLDIYRKIEGK